MRGCSCRGTAGFAHVSCLAEEAKILMGEAEENNLGNKVVADKWERWQTCSLCEQQYHGVVKCALGWACWKTYLGRPERDAPRGLAMSVLGNGLGAVKHHEAEFSVREAELAMLRRHGAPEKLILDVQLNLAKAYAALGRLDEATSMERDVYSGRLRLHGEEHPQTVLAANNYAWGLVLLGRFDEAKLLMRKEIPVARRLLGESHKHTLTARSIYGEALCQELAPRSTTSTRP